MSISPNNYAFDNKTHEPATDGRLVIKENFLDRAYRVFFGDDIFISHSRIDGVGYAKNLARFLQKKYRFVCFADFYWTEVGEKLPPFLIRKLKRSAILVVLITEGAVKWPKNIKEEVEIFKNTGRPIFVINLDDKYQKHEWPELHGIYDVKEFSQEKGLPRNQGRPSLTVLKSLKESFNYRTKYNQQRRSAFVAFALLMLSIIAVLGTSLYASNIVAQARNERNIALAAKERAGQELKEIQNKFSDTQNELYVAENDLFNARSDVNKLTSEKERAEKERNKAQRQQLSAEADAARANEKSKQADQSAKESERNRAEAEIREMGIRASSLATQPSGISFFVPYSESNRFSSLQLAKAAVDRNRKLNSPDMFDEVEKGLTDAVIALDFGKPLKAKGAVVMASTTSPKGNLIFGRILGTFDKFGKINSSGIRKSRYVIWDVKNPNEYVLLKEVPPPVAISQHYNAVFSQDERWLFTVGNGQLDFWEINKKEDHYEFQHRASYEDDFVQSIMEVQLNPDGSRIALTFFSGPLKNSVKVLVRDNYDLKPIGDALLPKSSETSQNKTIIFSPQNDLILGYFMPRSFWTTSFSSWEKPVSATPSKPSPAGEYIIYNITQQKLLEKVSVEDANVKLKTITETGDFIFTEKDVTNPYLEFIVTRPKDVEGSSRLEGQTLQESVLKPRYVDVKDEGLAGQDTSNAFFLDFVKMLHVPRIDSIDTFHFLEDGNSMIFKGYDGAGVITNRDGYWTRIFSTYTYESNVALPNSNWLNTSNNKDPHFYEPRADLVKKNPSYFIYYSSPSDHRFTLQIEDLKTSKKIQCSGSDGGGKRFLPERIYTLEDRYVVVLLRNYAISVYDLTTCEKVSSIKLETPHADFRVLDMSLGENKILRGLIIKPPPIGLIAEFPKNWIRTEFLITWDLSGINLHADGEITVKSRIYTIPKGFSSTALSDKAKEICIFARDNNSNPFILRLEDGELKPLKLEEDSVDVRNKWEGRFVAFSKTGDLVATLNDYSNVLRIWNMKTGKRVLMLALPESLENYRSTNPIDFSDDGKSIGIICKDGKVRFYPTSIDDFYKVAEKVLINHE